MPPWPFTDPVAIGALILLAAMIPTRSKRHDR